MSTEQPQTPEEKRKAHFEKATKACLKLALDNGGSCEMSDMHTFSESKWFIAHQQFSRLLEDAVANGLIEVEEYTINLTDKGRELASDA